MSPTRSRLRLLVPVVVLALAAAACGSSGSSKSGGTTGSGTALSGKINLVAYSTPQKAYADLIKAFNATAEGKNVSFSQSFGGSGDQSRAVVAGQPADVVAFSLEPDMTRLVDANMVAPTWNSDQYKGMVTRSVTVFAVRKGNPKGIKTWDDLVKPGVKVITPNPFQSGGAQWNIMAAWGAEIAAGKTEAQAIQYLKDLFKHVPVQDDSARKALQTFTGGVGDVMLAYENEAIFAKQQGEDLDYVVPDSTILIENPVAVTSNSKNPAAAKAFVAFLHTPAAQEIFVKNGYRPVVTGVPGGDKFPTPSGLFEITKFGGWSAVKTKFFDKKASIMKDVEDSIGVSAGG
jgi:sulfate transport system substrate-binding protein